VEKHKEGGGACNDARHPRRADAKKRQHAGLGPPLSRSSRSSRQSSSSESRFGIRRSAARQMPRSHSPPARPQRTERAAGSPSRASGPLSARAATAVRRPLAQASGRRRGRATRRRPPRRAPSRRG
jgi:hypothetical protein